MTDSRSKAQRLEAACREELADLWSDLNRAQQRALNSEWSMECDGLVDRIKMFTQLVGPTPWEDIQFNLLERGIYQRVHDDLGIEVSVDMVRVAEVQDRARAALKGNKP